MTCCPLFAHTTLMVVLWAVLAAFALIGLLAVVSPKKFTLVAVRGSRWVDTNKFAALLDKRVDVDRYVLPFSRLLGAVVILAVAVLTYVFWRYVH